MIVNADALHLPIASNSVQCVVTSPPYYGLRSYLPDNHPQKKNELGLESTPEEYVSNLVNAFREIWRVLKNDGTLWLNLGDSYVGGGRGGNGDTLTGRGKNASQLAHWNPNKSKRIDRGSGRWGGGNVPATGNLKIKDLIGIPWMVAFALRADGWYLRQEIIWNKLNPMPESVKDRCTKAHESLFLLSKKSQYYFDQEAIEEPCSPNTHLRISQNVAAQIGSKRANGGQKQNGNMKAVIRTPKQVASSRRIPEEKGIKNNDSFVNSICLPVLNRNKRSVWSISTEQFSGPHYAVFPEKFVEPCILAGSRPGDLILDPFSGSGTTGRVAIRYGRQFVGTELNYSNIDEISHERLTVQPYIQAFNG